MLNTDAKIRTELNSLPIREFVSFQREKGRRYIATSDSDDARKFRLFWAEQHCRAQQLLQDEGRGETVRQLAKLLEEVSFSLYMMSKGTEVSYYSYTDVHIIDWYLRPTHARFIDLKRRALHGILALLDDLSKFEHDSLVNLTKRHSDQLSKAVVTKRIEKIADTVVACQQLFNVVGLAWPDPIGQHPVRNTLEDYDAERLSALVHLTCFPRTTNHDEIAFLRTIHVSELCFFALRVILVQAIENLRRKRLGIAAHCFTEGAAIGKLLHRTFVVLNTMPTSHFQAFREYTESASAVQSLGYQLLDVYFRGLDPEKSEAIRSNPSTKSLLLFEHERFVHLQAILRQNWLREMPEWPKVEANARLLDATLKGWRGLHVAFAVKYLGRARAPSAEGSETDVQRSTGGTAGESYLRKFLNKGLFNDTDIDRKQLSDLSADDEWKELLLHVPPGHAVAPNATHRTLSRS